MKIVIGSDGKYVASAKAESFAIAAYHVFKDRIGTTLTSMIEVLEMTFLLEGDEGERPQPYLHFEWSLRLKKEGGKIDSIFKTPFPADPTEIGNRLAEVLREDVQLYVQDVRGNAANLMKLAKKIKKGG